MTVSLRWDGSTPQHVPDLRCQYTETAWTTMHSPQSFPHGQLNETERKRQWKWPLHSEHGNMLAFGRGWNMSLVQFWRVPWNSCPHTMTQVLSSHSSMRIDSLQHYSQSLQFMHKNCVSNANYTQHCRNFVIQLVQIGVIWKRTYCRLTETYLFAENCVSSQD